ncbi:hypothetical protein U9M48_018888 [Paspalum notatum var. saurae]|uniref:Uncharacterized protein n=1 Tax=Paspalum notatum var. saurae TaxID=547442 RepID=A0AAQ3WQY8_PASNO
MGPSSAFPACVARAPAAITRVLESDPSPGVAPRLRTNWKPRATRSFPPFLGHRSLPPTPPRERPPPPSALLCRRPSPLDCGRHRGPRR